MAWMTDWNRVNKIGNGAQNNGSGCGHRYCTRRTSGAMPGGDANETIYCSS